MGFSENATFKARLYAEGSSYVSVTESCGGQSASTVYSSPNIMKSASQGNGINKRSGGRDGWRRHAAAKVAVVEMDI